ncbi:N-acetylglutaminylglutamine amidotransferase [Cryptosporangium sp. NPDC051539]|uniref:N-acetylglutaminylglutamine amidotransferase n=1 Tax=Cryptosporangium sp. NPDC051539 TaxID=3363962 RepID=UPI0037B199F1
MCGFGGEIRFDKQRPDVDALRQMQPRLSLRGPDASGEWSHKATALVHSRLQIIDLSEAGAQPMTDPDPAAVGAADRTLVFNGCIYNYQQLRAELHGLGHTFFSTSDSEVILKAYRQWGERCVERFLGMFAFAIAEHDTGRLVIARDRLGIKPLYYTEKPGSYLRFSSTLPALLAAGVDDTEIDPTALHHYLSFHSIVPAPRTILRGVRKLPPATVRVIEPDGRSTDTVYWQPAWSRGEYAGLSSGAWSELVLERLRVAVERRMVADVPVGVLLSGGIDSSLVVALLAEAGQTGLQTFSIGFESEPDAQGTIERGDEFQYSDIIAKKFATEHHQIRIRTADIVPAVEATIGAMSEPMVSHDCVAFYLLSEKVVKHVKVVQSGQGADEIFAGYDWYPPLLDVSRDEAVEQYSRVFFDRRHGDLAKVLRPQWLEQMSEDPSTEFVRRHFAQPGAETTLDAALRSDSQIMLVDDPVKRVDNMTMAHGLEARVPFLDHELVELAAACPPKFKLSVEGDPTKQNIGKAVLKEAARGVVPDEVIYREKGYFPVPAIRHMGGPMLARVEEALRSPEARRRGLYTDEFIAKRLANPNSMRTNLGSNTLWQLATLEIWLQTMGVG